MILNICNIHAYGHGTYQKKPVWFSLVVYLQARVFVVLINLFSVPH